MTQLTDELLELEQPAAHSGEERPDVKALIAEARAQLEARQGVPEETRQAQALDAARRYFNLVEYLRRPWLYIQSR